MDYEKEGILASIDRSPDRVTVRDFEIEESLRLAFGEEHYLPALKEFLAWIELDALVEIRIKVERADTECCWPASAMRWKTAS